MIFYKRNILSLNRTKSIIGYFYTNAGKGVLESIGKEEDYFTYKYGSNGFPDKSANGLFEWAKTKTSGWGTMDTMPDIPGIAVRRDGHVGVYVGNNEVAEASCFKNGIILTKLDKSKWLNWYKIPGIKYGNSNEAPKIEDSIDTSKEVIIKKKVIAIKDINVRSGNSPIYPLLKTIPKGEQIEVLLDENNNPIVTANKWYAIQCDDKIGWISGYTVKEVN